MSRVIVIGDVHGCLEELEELLALLRPEPTDRVIGAGDLVDRGEDPVGVVRLFRARGFECVLGNHEEKHVRWAAYEERRRKTGERNPMEPFDEKRMKEHMRLSHVDRMFLASLPLFIRFRDGNRDWIVTHAGVPADKPIEQQKSKTLVRTRYVDAVTGAFAAKSDPNEIPTGAVEWQQRWRGPESIVHGHIVHWEPFCAEPVPGALCVGVDTGCCFGGKLTAAIFNGSGGRPGFVSVNAKRTYADYRHVPKEE